MSPYWQAWAQYPQQLFIAVDQLANALIPPWGGTLSYADETLSARSYRAHRDGRLFGKLTMPVIDLLFRWQVKEHCKGAWLKEQERRNLPPEYRPQGQLE